MYGNVRNVEDAECIAHYSRVCSAGNTAGSALSTFSLLTLAAMNLFDELRAILEKTILQELSSSLPPNAGVVTDWQDASVLHWFGVSVDADQDGKLYAAYSYGKAKTPKKLYQENLSRPEFDYYGNARFNMTGKDSDRYFEIRDAIKNGSMMLGQETDEDMDWDDEINTAPPTLIALALVAEHVCTTPAVIPMPCAATFTVTVSKDYETATWPATVQDLWNGGFEKWTDDQVAVFFGDSQYAALGRHLHGLCVDGKRKTISLTDEVADFLKMKK